MLADENAIRDAMRLVWTHLKLVIEPSSAVALAVVLNEPARFANRRIGIIVSGGNIDAASLPALLA